MADDILLNKDQIKNQLNHRNVNIEIFSTISSTNDYLKKFLNPAEKQITRICFAEEQTHGKGRQSRQWFSPFGKNIYFSCLYFSDKPLAALSGLSLIVSLATAKTLNEYTLPKKIFVKWPNDLIYEHKKISGNLIEIQKTGEHQSAVIVGIGINVNLVQEDSHAISQPWTSLKEIMGKSIDRNNLAASLINKLFNYLEKFEQIDMSYFLEEWNNMDGLIGKKICLKKENEAIEGVSQGVNKHGHLVIRNENGLQYFTSGDTTILKNIQK